MRIVQEFAISVDSWVKFDFSYFYANFIYN